MAEISSGFKDYYLVISVNAYRPLDDNRKKTMGFKKSSVWKYGDDLSEISYPG